MLRLFAFLMPRSLHEMIGDDGFTRLIGAFYRQIPDDDILGPIYPADDLAGAEQRLRDFLIFRFGGSKRYIEQPGSPPTPAATPPLPRRSARPRSLDVADGTGARRDPVARASRADTSRVLQRHRHVHDEPVIAISRDSPETRHRNGRKAGRRSQGQERNKHRRFRQRWVS